MITVKSEDGLVTKCVIHEFTYSGNFMGERSISATYSSDSPVDFAIFDYIEYRGERFELDYKPTDIKNASLGSIGNAFVYELTFVSLKYELERCQFRDLVPNDNAIVYPKPLSIEFTGRVNYLTERIQACLDSLYTGDKKWNITIADGVDSVEKNISISNSNCWDVLSLVNTEYDLNFTVVGRTITIGNTLPAINHVFEYGKGKGMYEIKRAAENETGIVTRLRAYGGTNNLDSGYLKDKEEWPSSIVPSSQYLPNLMLPGYDTTLIDYIDSDNIREYGIREASITYEDIYPSIIGATNSKGQRIDTLASVEKITNDNQTTFKVTTFDLEFEKDFETYLTNEPATISMRSGSLMGYGFQIVANGVKKISTGGYEFTLSRNTSDDYTVPNKNINLSAGDEFVFLNIIMPKKYILSAQDRLLSRAKEYLAEYDHTNYGYTIGLDELFIARNNSIYENVREGSKLVINDTDLNIHNESIIIQSLTIKEGSGLIPIYEVSLNNKPSSSTLNRIQGTVSKLESTVTNSFSNIKGLTSQYHQKLDKYIFYDIFDKENLGTDENPNWVLRVKYNVLFDYDFAIFGSKSFQAPSIVNAIPLGDGLAIVDGKLTAVPVGGGIDTEAMWNALAGSTNEQINKSHLTDALNGYALKSELPSLSGYATQTWVQNQGYLTQHQSLAGYATEEWVNTQIADNAYSLPTASSTVLGGVKIGQNISITDGVISTHAPYELTKDKILSVLRDANGIIELDASLVLSGDFAIYSTTKLNVPSIMDGLVLDNTTLAIVNGALTVVGGTGGLDETELASYLNAHNYYHAGNSNKSNVDWTASIFKSDYYQSLTNHSLLRYDSGTNVLNIGTSDDAIILAGKDNLLHYKTGGTYTIWDASNSNLSTVNWTCNGLNAYGYITSKEGWFQNDRINIGLYNSVANARWAAGTSGWWSDKPILITNGFDTKLVFNNTDGERYTSISFQENGAQYASIIADGRTGSAFISLNDLPTKVEALYFKGTGIDAIHMGNNRILGSTSASYLVNSDNNWYLAANNGGRVYLESNSLDPMVRKGGSDYTIWHSGNMGAGSGLNADTLDGYHRSYLFDGENDFLRNGTNGYCQRSIEISGDKDTYYPVVINVSNNSNYIDNVITISKTLGSKTPAWAGNHENGTSSGIFSFHYRIGVWDGNGKFLNTIRREMPYANWVGHMEFASSVNGKAVVWLRGGGAQYWIHCNNALNDITPYYSRTNLGSDQYTAWVEPKTSGNYGFYANGATNPCFQTVYLGNHDNYISTTSFNIGAFNASANTFSISGIVSSDPTYNSISPKIVFANDENTQKVAFVYTDFDSYRAPAGIRLHGSQGDEWLEAPRLYATNRLNIGNNDFWSTPRLTIASTNYPLAFYNPNGTANKRKYYFSLGSDYFNINSLNDGNGYVNSLIAFDHDGRTTIHGVLKLGNGTITNTNNNQILAGTSGNHVYCGGNSIAQLHLETTGGYNIQCYPGYININHPTRFTRFDNYGCNGFGVAQFIGTNNGGDVGIEFNSTNNRNFGMGVHNNGNFYFWGSGNATWNSSSGKSYFGLINLSSNMLEWYGSIVMTGDFVIYKSSDIRLKSNLKRFDAHSLINKLGGVYEYDYTDEAMLLNPSQPRHSIGLIAQNVEKYFPFMVHEHKGYKSVNYYDTQFISLLAACEVQTISKLSMLEKWKTKEEKEIEQLKKENRNLRKRVSTLEELVNDKI